jgi:hypothetical protein
MAMQKPTPVGTAASAASGWKRAATLSSASASPGRKSDLSQINGTFRISASFDIGVQQHHLSLAFQGQRKACVDRADEAQVHRILDQRDAALRLGRRPSPQEGAHARVGRGILDQDQMPGQVGVAANPVQRLGQQVEGVEDRQHDGDRVAA